MEKNGQRVQCNYVKVIIMKRFFNNEEPDENFFNLEEEEEYIFGDEDEEIISAYID